MNTQHQPEKPQQQTAPQHTLLTSAHNNNASAEHILACNASTHSFGLSLTAEQAHELACSHAHVLNTYERVEFEGNGVAQIIEGFASSFYLEQATYASTLDALQEKFYELRAQATPDVFDEDIIDGMRLLFDGDAVGTIELLNACTLDMVLEAYDTQTGSLAQRTREVVGDLTQTSEIPQFENTISSAHVFDTDDANNTFSSENARTPSTIDTPSELMGASQISDACISVAPTSTTQPIPYTRAQNAVPSGAEQKSSPEHSPLTHTTPAQSETVHKNILFLFLKLCRLYTGGGSSSVSRSEAYDLLHSLRYVLHITSLDDPTTQARLSCDNIEALFNQELQALGHRVDATMELLREARATMPPLQNVALADTLASIGQLRNVYDVYFAAYAVPVSFDYPLHNPITEPLEGIDYVHEWLLRFLEEARTLAQLDVDECKRVLEATCPGYEHLVINLYEPLYRHFHTAQ